jgi:hypothetical protein
MNPIHVASQLPDWQDAVATGRSRSASGDFGARIQISVVLEENVCVSTGCPHKSQTIEEQIHHHMLLLILTEPRTTTD